MAIPILRNWQHYFANPDEGLGSSYERIILNRKLAQICRTFDVSSVLEAPSFGFTGISGINSMNLAKEGKPVTIVDNNAERLQLIEKIWKKVELNLTSQHVENFSDLPFNDKTFDLSWNFSALWFVQELDSFLNELVRITRKVIFICVPNRTGIGYLSQKLSEKEDLKKELNEQFIFPEKFICLMRSRNWQLLDKGFIDCPPWPDIGMPKDDFLRKLGLGWLLPDQKQNNSISILNYYEGKDNKFPDKMLKHFWFEKNAPFLIKKFWAHHRFFVFIPGEK